MSWWTAGRSALPLAYFSRLFGATPQQREHYVISGGGTGLHWEEIDEDISVEALLTGQLREKSLRIKRRLEKWEVGQS